MTEASRDEFWDMAFQIGVNAHFNVEVQFRVLILEKWKTP